MKRVFNLVSSVSPIYTGMCSGIAVFLLISLSVLILARHYHNSVHLMLEDELRTLAEAAASTIDGDLHNTIRDPGQMGGAAYAKAVKPLVEIHNRFKKITYLYTMIEKDGEVFFILDTAADPRLITDRVLKASSVMEKFKFDPITTRGWLETVRAGKTFVDPKLVTDEFGAFISGSTPFRDSLGNYAGFVGVDYDAATISKLDREVKVALAISLGIGLVLSLFIGVIIWNLKRVADTYFVEIRDREERLTVARDELEKLNTQKDKFFLIIAHDLRGPFTALMGFSRILATKAQSMTPDQVAEYGSMVNRAADQAHQLLEDLLDWSRLQFDRIEFEPDFIDVGELIKTNISRFEPTAALKNIELDGGKVHDLRIFADAHMVDTILRNLISNAIKFTAQQGGVTVTARQSGNWAKITVADTGVGMTADKVARLFLLDEATSTFGTAGETGTGLGLQLCKELIEKLGGQIRVDSSDSEGTTFSVNLPLHKP